MVGTQPEPRPRGARGPQALIKAIALEPGAVCLYNEPASLGEYIGFYIFTDRNGSRANNAIGLKKRQ